MKRVMVLMDDRCGLPRAWATGLPDHLEAVKEAARRQLLQYLNRKKTDGALDPGVGLSSEDFTEHVEYYFAGDTKTYRGFRPMPHGGACGAIVVPAEGDAYPLDPRHDLRNHSPAGFQWGYGGSGPAQLALALLADLTGDDEYAQANYITFKRKCIALLPQGCPWEFDSKVLEKTLAEDDAFKVEA